MPVVLRRKLTKRVVDSIAPLAAGDVLVWDTDIAGFRLRVRKTGRKVYELRYRTSENRAQRQITIGRHGSPWTPESARDKARAILRDADGGQDPLDDRADVRSALTVAELCDAYLQQGPIFKPTKRESTWKVDRYVYRHHLKPLLGTRLAKSIRPADLAQWQAKVATGATAKREPSGKPRGTIIIRGGRGAAARAMRSVAAMLAWATLEGLIEANPALAVRKIPDGRRERYLTDEEAVAIWTAIKTLLNQNRITITQAAFFRLLMLTGARRGEILHLRWREVDLSRGILLLPPARHKSGGQARSKTLHLSEAAREVLRELRNIHSGMDHVFPAQLAQAKFGNRDGEVRDILYCDHSMSPPKAAWDRILDEAKVPDVTFHTLRHTFASQIVADGTSLYTLSKLLGHARISTTERYAHLRSDAGLLAADTVAARYSSAIGVEQRAVRLLKG